jgi:outer membrane protein assembly factor BamB
MTTTRCCSAFALIAASMFATVARATDDRPMQLAPTRTAWDLPLNSPLTAPPALAGRRGYFPLEGGRLAAYNIEHGVLLWLVSAHAVAPPAIGDGLVFIVEPDALKAVHEDTGSIAWRVPSNEPLSGPLVWNNGWLVGTTVEGAILALRALDGGLLWQRRLDARTQGAVTLAADRVYVPLVDGRIVALHVKTGEPIWERRLGGAPSEILVADDRIFVGSKDNHLYSIRARDGAVVWRFETGADVVGLPAVDDRSVFFVSLDNLLRGLDRRTGGQRWKRALPLRPVRGPIIVADTLIVSGVSPTAQLYLTTRLTPAGEIEAGGEMAAAPHVVPGAVLPTVVFTTRHLEAGTVVRAVKRAIDPTAGTVGPLPNSSLSPPTAPGEPAPP